MIVSLKIERDGLPSRVNWQTFRFRQDLPNAGKTRAEIGKGHVQRPAIEFRYGKAQLVIFTAGERPAQRLLRLNLAQHRIRERHRIKIDARAAAAGLENMPQVRNQAVGEIDGGVRQIAQRLPLQNPRQRTQMARQEIIRVGVIFNLQPILQNRQTRGAVSRRAR